MVCGSDDKEKEVPKRPLSDEDLAERKCTDVLCLLLFLLFLVGEFVITGIAFDKGDYRKIVNGIDYQGCACDFVGCFVVFVHMR